MKINSTDQEIHLDRSKPFDLSVISIDGSASLFNYLASYYVVHSENPKSTALINIDLSRIELKTIFEEPQSENEDPDKFNDLIKTNLAELENSGYILLDAKVLEVLLSTPELIPKDWERLTDADSPVDDGGTIGFYGTLLRSVEQPQELVILTPFFNRGNWESCGHNSLYFSDEFISLYKRSPVANIRKFAAVYSPEEIKR